MAAQSARNATKSYIIQNLKKKYEQELHTYIGVQK